MRLWGAVSSEATIPFVVAAAPVAWLAANEGGYFPEQWSGPTLVLLWIAMFALIVGGARLPGRPAVAILGVATLLTTWIGVSVAWSTVPSQSVLELERALLYTAALAAALLVVHEGADAALGGVVSAITLVCSYALAVRLFPNAFDVAESQPHQSAALFEPIGYSNALGAFAAVGLLLALGFAADGSSRLSRASAAAAVVPLATVVYLAFSRGAWLALAAGLVAAVALAPARVRLLTAWLAGPIPCAAFAIACASQADALLRVEPSVGEAALQGALLSVVLVLLSAAAAAASFVASNRRAERRRVPAAPALLLVVSALVAAFVFATDRPLRPATVLRADRGASVALSYRDEFWGAAWNAFEERPVTGFGAGAFEQYWLQHREHPRNARDAHNLYFEALAELGAPGLALFAALLGIPIAAAVLARARPLVPAAAGGLTVYLAHAVVDWGWEVPALTVAALFVVSALVAAEGHRPIGLPLMVRALAVAVLLGASAFSVVALVANRSGAAAQDALRAGAAERAEAEARRASRWAQWSSHPLRTLADAQLLQDDREAARETIRKALAKGDRDWRLWLALAIASDGRERRAAFEQAERLNPVGRRIAELRRILNLP
jgi:O-Antigen ligase